MKSQDVHSVRYAFLHFDGVILENILTPITHAVVTKLGGKYTSEIEYNVFARSQVHAAKFIKDTLRLKESVDEIIAYYYKEREEFEKSYTPKVNPGVLEFLSLLQNKGIQCICYGGAPKEYFSKHIGSLSSFLGDSDYIQTKEFRPGVKELAFDRFGLQPKEALFIDEAALVGETCKQYGIPFIGISLPYHYSHQTAQMKLLGIKIIISSLVEINEAFFDTKLKCIDEETFWNY
ncbi:haloacid dehalogenase domain protein hydrolase [Leptospira ryugenii]|uniref:Haloacid dehalogenase domain protein hydrolase n=1 Tax=Leptospira ryugenii TaxID=1917863 RepID=A0A2P2E586_9LEPT|nr:HAD family hydrolase [Leptospira ryugenii]GBF52038.1 haloacid dehalogenase domain protein hydrolase [Leptospira ryugenii]